MAVISQQIIAPPLQDVRVAMYARLASHAATSAFNLLKEGREASFPYYAVGPAYLGEGGTDTIRPVKVVVQIEAYALSRAGGSNKVSEMMTAIQTAVNSQPITIAGHDPLIFIFEAAILSPHMRDSPGAEMYAQMIHRYRTLIIKS